MDASFDASMQEYVFCCSEGNPPSLVMLCKKQKILSKLIKSQQTVYLWVCPQTAKEMSYANELCEKLKIQLVFLHSCDSVVQYVKSSGQRFIYLICKESMGDSFAELLKHREVLGVVYYPWEGEKMYAKQMKQDAKISKVKSEQELEKCLCENLIKNGQYNQLPNFVSLNDNIWQSNLIVRSLMGMLNQDIDLETRRKVVGQFKQVLLEVNSTVETFGQLDYINMFVESLSAGHLTPSQAIDFYVAQSLIYKITNNILRCCEHPTQLFYVQPYFQDLYRAIRKIFWEQSAAQKQRENRPFTCFRGGLISQKQASNFLKSKHCMVQNLGFLSTSTNKQKAEQFKNNVFFTIKVGPCRPFQSRGYAKLDSKTSSEEEVLFNPLNTFYMRDIQTAQQEEGQLVYYIDLQYRDLQQSAIETAGDDKLKIIHKQLQHQSLYSTQMVSQGDTMLRCNEVLQGALEYWTYFTGQAKSNKLKVMGLMKLAICLNARQHYQEALNYQQQCLQIIKKSQQPQSFQQMYALLNNMANLHSRLNNYGKAAELYENSNNLLVMEIDKMQKVPENKKIRFLMQENLMKTFINRLAVSQNHQELLLLLKQAEKALQKVKKYYGQHSELCAVLLMKMGQTYLKMQKYAQSISALERASHLYENSLGLKHPHTAVAFGLLSDVLTEMKQFQKAKQCIKKVLDNRLEVYGKFSAEYCEVLNLLAQIYSKQQKRKKAVKIYQHSLSLQSQAEHPDTLLTARTLAMLARQCPRIGDLNLCAKLLKQSADIHRSSQRGEKIELIKVQKQLAACYLQMGNKRAAEEILLKCFELELNNRDENFVETICRLGDVLQRKEGVEWVNLAISLYEHAYQLSLTLKFTPAPLIAQILQHKGFAYSEINNLYKVREAYEESQKVCRQRLGIKHRIFILNEVNLSRLKQHTAKFEKMLQPITHID